MTKAMNMTVCLIISLHLNRRRNIGWYTIFFGIFKNCVDGMVHAHSIKKINRNNEVDVDM